MPLSPKYHRRIPFFPRVPLGILFALLLPAALWAQQNSGTPTPGARNTATGLGALASDTTGSNNTADGYDALTSNTTGGGNTASSASALASSTTAEFNTASGSGALASDTTGSSNTADGYDALSSNTTAEHNTASGSGALRFNTSGSYNTATGDGALNFNTSGEFNTTSGVYALGNNTTGDNNTAIGFSAGYGYVGYGGDANTTGSSNTFVGAYSAPATTTQLTNATAIGANAAVTANNALVLGSINGVNGATTSTSVGIGTTAPTNVFTIAQGAGLAISDGWTTYSSLRWKTNIRTLTGALASVEKLRGVSYDQRDTGKHEIGVIAEEVGKVLPEVVEYEPSGSSARGVDYSRLTSVLIEAVKEQQAEIAQLTLQVRALQASLRTIDRKSLVVSRAKSRAYAAPPTTNHMTLATVSGKNLRWSQPDEVLNNWIGSDGT